MFDHIGLQVKNLDACGRGNGTPGLWLDYRSNYYGAVLIDTDDNNVEAVCFL